MGYATKIIVSGALSVALLMGVVGCSSSNPAFPAEIAQDTQAKNEQALADYADLERETLPQVMAQNPGIYADVTVESDFLDSSGDAGIPAGTYAVLMFTYRYANAYDWPMATALLDGQRTTFDDACRTTIFPAMRNAGITGPLGVQFSYLNGGDADQVWNHPCSE